MMTSEADDADDPLRGVVTSLGPYLARLGLVASTVIPYIKAEANQQRITPHSPSFLNLDVLKHVHQHETGSRELAEGRDLAVQYLLRHILTESTYPGMLRVFVTALLKANNSSKGPNPKLWRVHDVLELASVYWPLHQTLVGMVREREGDGEGKVVDMERVITHLNQQGVLSPDNMAAVLDQLHSCGMGAATELLLALLYAARVDLLSKDFHSDQPRPPPQPHPPSSSSSAVNGEDVAAAAAAAAATVERMEEGEEEEEGEVWIKWIQVLVKSVGRFWKGGGGGGGGGGHEREEEVLRRLPAEVFSSETWMSAYDKMAYGALGQFIDVDDNDKDSDDETVIADDDDDDDDNDDIEQGTTHAPLMETRNRTQAENETRRKRTAEFVFGTESRVQLQTIRHLREELDILMSLGENDALPGSSAHSQSGESSTMDGDYFSVLDSLSTENNSHVTDSSNLEQFALLTSSLGDTGANSLDDDFDREITLRDYQVEVIEPAREGQNVIIILPTGTGKTHPVIKYAQEHLSSKGQLRRVVFLAPKVKLALFQYFRFLHYFPQQTYFRCGKVRSSCAPFSELLQTYKVFVMTPMCLVEAVHHGELELADFSLLVLDECHHAALGRHAYRVLMDLYVDVKLAPRTTAATEADSSSVAATTAAVALPPLPQVVGLTASPGVGQAKTVEAAMIHIRDLCFIMDVECLGVPRTHQQQLEDYTNQPSHEMHTCPPRKTDGFRNAVGRLMKQIEDKMVAFADLEQGQNKDSLLRVLDAPGHQRGHIRYTQWVCNLENRLMDLTISRDLTRSLISMAEMLTVYQRALALNEDCESRYALDLLQRQVDDLESRTPEHGLVERQLLDQYKCHKAELEQTCSDPEDYNPKLRMLESILRDVLDQYQDQCACMVFVRTVELSKAIQKWVENHPVLKQLKPGRVTGTRRGQDERGMTRNEAAEVLNKFNIGEHGMVVCTSAAEEGLDFQACNIVIRYDYVTSMISMVQTRGRARRMDSQYCVLGGTPQGNLVKEQENLALERLMRTALHRQKDAMDRNPNAFRHASNLWQQQRYRERREKERSATLRRQRAQTTTEDTYRLLCRKCRTEVCLSTDLRVLEEAPNAVVGGVLGDRCTRKDLGEPEHYKQHLEKVARLDCSNCGRAWGSVNRYIPTGREFPLLKLEYFILLNLTTGQLNKAKLKWGKAPFRESVLPISEEELGLM